MNAFAHQHAAADASANARRNTSDLACAPVITWRDHLLGLLLCGVYVALLLATAGDIGMSRDEGIYVDAAQSYGRWLQLLVAEPSTALSQPQIDAAFRVNSEHPPLMKLLFALGYLAHQHFDLFATDSQAFRSAGMLSAGLLLWLIYVFGARLFGRRAGLFAALAYALLPRPFYHAHLNAFDVPIACAITAVTYAYYRSLQSRGWAALTGVLYGLALLTKHNAWILPGIFGIHFAWVAYCEHAARKRQQPRRVSLVPYWLFAIPLVSVPIFLLGWPWLWNEPLARFGGYARFHLHHDYYNLEYFGVNYFWPPFPISYPWVLTLFTVPLSTLVLACAGLFERVRAASRQLRDFFTRKTQRLSDPTQATVLLLGALFAPLLLISLPSTPIFGGTKHWFTAYPFLALFAGRAFALAWDALSQLMAARARRLRNASGLALGALLLAPSAVETAHSHPFGLSHYTVAAGGVAGAAELGMNRQFWGFTTRSLVPFLRDALPQGGSVYICDTIYSAFHMLVRDGLLPSSIRPTSEIARADYALVHHELHFAEVDHQIWTTYGSVQPVYVLRYAGVPIISVYKNPKSRQ